MHGCALGSWPMLEASRLKRWNDKVMVLPSAWRITYTHSLLLGYWSGKYGDVMLPDCSVYTPPQAVGQNNSRNTEFIPIVRSTDGIRVSVHPSVRHNCYKQLGRLPASNKIQDWLEILCALKELWKNCVWTQFGQYTNRHATWHESQSQHWTNLIGTWCVEHCDVKWTQVGYHCRSNGRQRQLSPAPRLSAARHTDSM